MPVYQTNAKTSKQRYSSLLASDRIRRQVEGMLHLLSERQREVLIRRYGLGGHHPMSAAEIKEIMPISRKTIYEDELAALEVLKAAGVDFEPFKRL